jgi:hypothetical protein
METGAANNLFSGDPTFAGIKWERRTDEGFAYDLSYNFTGADMHPEVGFLRRNDIHGFNSRLQYGWMPGEESKLFRYSARFGARRYARVSDGELESMEISPGWFLMTKSGFGVFGEVKFMREGVEEDFDLSDEAMVPAGQYDFAAFEAMIFTPSSKPIGARIRLEAGGFFDGNIVSVSVSPILNLSSSLQLSGEYEFNDVNFPDRMQSLQSHIARASVLYMYSTKLSVSTFVQINDAREVFVGNFRIRYNPREGNDFYLVFNEYRGFMQSESIPAYPPYHNRAILLKYNHTFRL